MTPLDSFLLVVGVSVAAGLLCAAVAFSVFGTRHSSRRQLEPSLVVPRSNLRARMSHDPRATSSPQTFCVEEHNVAPWLCVTDGRTVTRLAVFMGEDEVRTFNSVLATAKVAAREQGRLGL